MKKWAFVLGLVVVTFAASAGTIITANLPANTIIANMNATTDGAAGYGGNNQQFWYSPFSSTGTLPTYTFPTGTYTFRVVNPTDAAARFPALTGSQLSQIYTAWTYNSPWIEDYLVFDSAATNNSTIPQIFDGAPDPNSFGNATDAYNDAVTHDWANLIRSSPDGRLGTNFTDHYTVTNTSQTLVFVIPDYGLSDNNGGVSVLVSFAPILTIANATPGNVILKWPVNGTAGYNLEQEITPATWTAVATTPASDTTNYSVTLPAVPNTRFFRLHKQN